MAPKQSKGRKKKPRLTKEQIKQLQERIQKIIETNAEVVSYKRYKKNYAADNTENNDDEACNRVNNAATMTELYPVAIQKATNHDSSVDAVSSTVSTAVLRTRDQVGSNICGSIKTVNDAATKSSVHIIQIPCKNVALVNASTFMVNVSCAAPTTPSPTTVTQMASNNNNNYSTSTSSSNSHMNTHPSNASLQNPTDQVTPNAAVLNSSNISMIPLGVTKSGTNGDRMVQPGPSNKLVPILIDEKLYYLSPGFGKTIAEVNIVKKTAGVGKDKILPASEKPKTDNKKADQSKPNINKQSFKELFDEKMCDMVKKGTGDVDDSRTSLRTDANDLSQENVPTRDESNSFENINMSTEVFSFQGTEIKKEVFDDEQTLDKNKMVNTESHDQEVASVHSKTVPNCATVIEEDEDQSKEVEEEEMEEEEEEEETETEEESTDDESEEDIDYDCPCGKVFLELAKYEKHKLSCKNKDSDYELSESSSEFEHADYYYCSCCGKTFDNEADLEKHEQACHSDVEHSDNDTGQEGKSVKTVKRRNKYLTEEPVVERTYTVGWVNSKGKVIFEKRVHLKKKKRCIECNRLFGGEIAYACHKLLHENEEAGISYECKICPEERFSVETQLQAHENLAHGAKHKPFQCKHCNKKFISASATDTHALFAHDGGHLPFKCQECLSTFTRKELFMEHMESHANKKLGKTMPCEECEKSFVTWKALKNHMRSHKKYPCETCGKLFSMHRIKVHIQTHAEVLPYECTVCKKRFAQRTNLNSHKRVHTGKKPYECDICSRAFNHKVSLKTHKKSAHSIDWWADNDRVQKPRKNLKGKPLWKPLRK